MVSPKATKAIPADDGHRPFRLVAGLDADLLHGAEVQFADAGTIGHRLAERGIHLLVVELAGVGLGVAGEQGVSGCAIGVAMLAQGVSRTALVRLGQKGRQTTIRFIEILS